jgi:hypothetical protein
MHRILDTAQWADIMKGVTDAQVKQDDGLLDLNDQELHSRLLFL